MKESVEETLLEAQEELKRVDHIIYVSLKYTRTVDVIRNALNRLVAMFDKLIDALLLDAEQKGQLKAIPRSPRLKADKVRELYPEDKRLAFYIDFYLFLRDLANAPYERREEFRRQVTLIARLDTRTADVNIDTLEDNFNRVAKGFMSYAKQLILGIPPGSQQ